LLPDPRPVYVITVFENFSRAVLSSAISQTQTQWDFLSVLTDAIRRYGAPEALVTDGGGQFYSGVALQLYDMLGIRKERIEPGEPWMDYAETLFSIQRRLADFAFSNARTWPEIQQAHQTWWQNYNQEKHYAHRERQDGRHSPLEVLSGMLGRTIPEEVLSRALYATQFTRQINKHGYVRFKHWKFFGENGLPAGEEVSVWIYENTRDPLSIRRQPSHCIPFVWIKTSRSPRSKMLAAWKHTFAARSLICGGSRTQNGSWPCADPRRSRARNQARW
jgi:hypothetical protein